MKRLVVLVVALILALSFSLPASAQQPDLELRSKAAVLMDARSGEVLFQKNEEEPMVPASLVKIMTLKVAKDAIADGRITPETVTVTSERAWRASGGGRNSTMWLNVGQKVSVDDLLKGIAVVSGNDACVALAELISGSEEVFVAEMNDEARRLGLENTRFVDSHGLSAENTTTALDMARLARAYVNSHERATELNSIREFTFNGISQYNRNGLLWTYQGADGLKTGFTEAAGYNLVATAERNGMRFIAVVLGAQPADGLSGEKVRERDAVRLLDYAFANFVTVDVLREGTEAGSLPVFGGRTDRLSVLTAEGLTITTRRGQETLVEKEAQLPSYVRAPVEKGEKVGEMVVTVAGREKARVDLVAAEEVTPSGFFSRLWDSVRLFFLRLLRRI